MLLAMTPQCADTKYMAQQKQAVPFEDYVAVTTAIFAVLAAIASLHSGTNASLMILEKNNANLYQNQANKEWNTYLAQEIVSVHDNAGAGSVAIQRQAQETLQHTTNGLQEKVSQASDKAQYYFEKNGNLSTAGTFLEIAIAISAMSILIKKKSFWIFSLLLGSVGIYFFALGFI
jgi:hypothetical protein